MSVLQTQIALPVLGQARLRPVFAQGPRSLESLRLLRISVTDRCNLRCAYCMPEEGVKFQPKEELLTPREIYEVARVARSLGVTHVKITGGEPTIRRDLPEILEGIFELDFEDVSLTTNGLQLRRSASLLRRCGVDRLTISLDSLQPDRYAQITGGGRLDLVWDGIAAAEEAGFDRLKINVVVLRGINDDEVGAFAELAVEHPWTIRFIEYMPLGESRMNELSRTGEVGLLASSEVRRRIEASVGELSAIERKQEPGVGPAEVFTNEQLQGRVGFISAMSQPFCDQCNRLRLTARGELRACLFDGGEIDVRAFVRPHVRATELRNAFTQCTQQKPITHGVHGNRQMSQLGG